MSQIKIVHVPEDGISIEANRRHMEEVFLNLVLNARDAMEETGGELSLAAKEAGEFVKIEIKDSGPGIPKENRDRIFDPFFTTKFQKGTGLGLYIVKQLVERNGGKISVKSKPGEGTT